MLVSFLHVPVQLLYLIETIYLGDISRLDGGYPGEPGNLCAVILPTSPIFARVPDVFSLSCLFLILLVLS